MKATSNRSGASSSANTGTRAKGVRMAKMIMLTGRLLLVDLFVNARRMFIYLGSVYVISSKTASNFAAIFVQRLDPNSS